MKDESESGGTGADKVLTLQRPRGRLGWKVRLALVFGVGAILASIFPVSCALDARAAQDAQKRLDTEIRSARTSLNIPDALLLPITKRENTLSATMATNTAQAYQEATAGYNSLYAQVVAIEHMPVSQARALAQKDLTQLDAALQPVEKEGFVEAAVFRSRQKQAQTQLDATTTLKDIFTVDAVILAQTDAVQRIRPVFQQYQTLAAQVDDQNKALGIVSSTPAPLQCARGANDTYFWPNAFLNVALGQGGPYYEYQQWPALDLALFRAAASAKDFAALSATMSAQSQQLSANMALISPTQAVRLLNAFQAEVQTYQQDGGKDTSFQQQADKDTQALTQAKTLADYSALARSIETHRHALAFPLLQVKTRQDVQTLQGLVNQAQAIKTIDPANGIGYPDAYEYASASTGIGDARDRLAAAQTQVEYQAVDDELQMFITNIQAMLQNLNDTTPSEQMHKTDLTLLQHYSLTDTKVMVVSLREQAARMYEQGKLVKAFNVTTGNPDLPSPPGVHCVLWMRQNYDDVSPFPKGSPYYYNPTHINYGLLYSDYGYFVHDAWWRSWFGKYSNLPHYDPISFNNGSHGCINLALGDMTWLFNWVENGTPIVVY